MSHDSHAWIADLPPVRGKIMTRAALAPFTWFRVGGPADVIFLPEDAADLSEFLKNLDPGIPVLTIGVGSNLLVRDGGIEGVVIRLGRNFADVIPRGDARIEAGAAALDANVAKVAAHNGIAGLEFYRGVPGTIGGALTMNAGCYGSETKDVLVEAYAITRAGERVTISNADMGFRYRHSEPEGVIYTGALFQGTPDDAAAVTERMEAITARREQTQPIREKTGGSTFKNPEGKSAWQCVDEAGWRGKLFGAAKFSELHSNFMINTGDATAAELEGLGEAVRADVMTKLGIDLQWEIKRIGKPV
ncbi:UDP-N-acetylmuramate dehydrogenase [Asticcacaulis taihuensis]|uniref:UDP-N-acetylenolpyruvoylglucosamine reductase n=1 Tax=Asticcacaulis taihuensis TaxID=260084 RepID=A0A1G4QQ15_9CAUL|nr:UDP-N-acetylmuramate dehydrogenase [Asticcacaulis taihuensis]SCW46511.1 UDP-N-acetylmuramate dehydrogenase [Asticcacaulis taihuensis]